MGFCQYCGTNVGEGMVCNCEGAVQARAAVASNPAPVEAPVASNPAPAVSPVVQVAPSQASVTAKATMNEVSGTLKAFVKDPMAVTSSDKSIGLFAAITLLAIQAICLVVFIWVFTSGSLGVRSLATDKIDTAKITASKNDMTLNAYITEKRVDAKESLSNYEKMTDKKVNSLFKMMGMAEVNDLSYSTIPFILNLLLISLLNSAIIFGALFLCAKLFKSNDDYIKILSTVSLASIPWSILWLVFTVIKFVTEKSSGTLISIVCVLTIFILVASVCLLFSGLTKSFQNSYKRLLSVSLTYGIGVPVYFFLVGKCIENAPLLGTIAGEFLKILVSSSLPGIF